MLKSEIPSKLDTVAVGEVQIDLKGGNFNGQEIQFMDVSAKFVLVSSADGTRIGPGTNHQWSATTRQKVQELVAAMEADICVAVFGQAPTSSGGAVVDTPNSDGVPAL